MKDRRAAVLAGFLAALLLGLLAGCATHRIDWGARVGVYTFDEAIAEFGPPDKSARLGNGSTVAEWLTHRGYTYVYRPFAGYSCWYGPYSYPDYLNAYTSPDAFLRLTFSADNKLLAWKRVYR